MDADRFEFISRLLLKRSGLVLGADKIYLLETRLRPLALKRGLETLDALVDLIRQQPDEELLDAVTDAMTTNETSFFRDAFPFQFFREVHLPQILDCRRSERAFRIWCAASSTGQEPYTIAMTLGEEAQKLAGWNVEIVATDISGESLKRAREGLYSQFEVQRGMPIQLLLKYFRKQGDMWRIDEKIRQMVSFRRVNLLENFSSLGRFDAVFCRNVLIYFDQTNKADILDRMSESLAEQGRLYLGGAETVLGVSDKFAILPGHRGVYGKVAPKAVSSFGR